MQPYGVCRLWIGILLVMHERDKRFALSEVNIFENQ